jgi:NarL family two-component system response regulator LiaR
MTLPLPPVRVAVMNDYPVVIAGLVTLLKPYSARIQVEGYVQTLPPPGRADVVLLDTFGRPDRIARLRQAVDETGAPVLLYTWPNAQEQIDAAFRAGAVGVLSKTLDAQDIMTALEETLAGRPPGAVPLTDETPMLTWPGQQEGLSARESEILCLIVAGLSNQDIAKRSYLSLNTVKTYIRTAYRKINAETRTQAVLWGIDHGLRAARETADSDTI